MPSILLDWFTYQPIKSVTSEKLAREAFLLPDLDLYHSQVGLVTWAYPKAVDGLLPGIKPKYFFLSGFANCWKDDSCLIIDNCKAIGTSHLSKLFFVDLYQYFFSLNRMQLLSVFL